MSVELFDAEDSTFFAWMLEHGTGFVANTHRRSSSRYFFLHESNCRHISGHATGYRQDAFTGHDYVKVCAESPRELLEWARTYRPRIVGFSDVCQSCDPDDSEAEVLYPEIDVSPVVFTEGKSHRRVVKQVERSSRARKACLEKWGNSCSVCEMAFGKVYGELGEGYIHVHHLNPVASMNEEYQIDPVNDLRPVCPNCHAMLHQENPPIKIDQLRTILRDLKTKSV